jgi:replicative DNA helicase
MSLSQTPTDTLLEKGVIAALFDDAEIVPVISNVLNPADFIEPRHELIYDTILYFVERNEHFDILKVASHLNNEGSLGRAGGVQYLIELTDAESIYRTNDPVGYALLIQESSRKRQLSLAFKSADEKTRLGSGYDADDVLSFAQETLHKLAETNSQQDVERIGNLLGDAFETIAYKGTLDNTIAVGVPSGFVDLDAKTTGFLPGQFWILAARPAMGKTTLAIDFARAASLMDNKTTIFFSLEMGKDELVQKILSAEAKIEFEKIKKGNINKEEWEKLHQVRERIAKSDLLIDDTAILSLVNLRTKCLKQKNTPEGLDLVIVDYLQLMEAPKSRSSSDGRQHEVSMLSRGLKLLAKELEIPIIVLSQLNRGNEARADKTPLPSDLRESGSLEQDADGVLLLHRPEYYDETDRPGQAQLIIGKHRGGPTATIQLIPLLEFSKFANGAGKFAVINEPNDNEPPAGECPPDNMEDPFAEEPPTPEGFNPTSDVLESSETAW